MTVYFDIIAPFLAMFFDIFGKECNVYLKQYLIPKIYQTTNVRLHVSRTKVSMLHFVQKQKSILKSTISRTSTGYSYKKFKIAVNFWNLRPIAFLNRIYVKCAAKTSLCHFNHKIVFFRRRWWELLVFCDLFSKYFLATINRIQLPLMTL